MVGTLDREIKRTITRANWTIPEYYKFCKEWCEATLALNKSSPNRNYEIEEEDEEIIKNNENFATGNQARKMIREAGLGEFGCNKITRKLRHEGKALASGEGKGASYMYSKTDIQEEIRRLKEVMRNV